MVKALVSPGGQDSEGVLGYHGHEGNQCFMISGVAGDLCCTKCCFAAKDTEKEKANWHD